MKRPASIPKRPGAPRRLNRTPQKLPLKDLAARAHYAGSAAHKLHSSPLGPPRARRNRDASICDLVDADSFRRANDWLKSAIRVGQFSEEIDQSGFPKRVWHVEGEIVYEAMYSGGTLGAYKGWILERALVPRGLLGSRGLLG